MYLENLGGGPVKKSALYVHQAIFLCVLISLHGANLPEQLWACTPLIKAAFKLGA